MHLKGRQLVIYTGEWNEESAMERRALRVLREHRCVVTWLRWERRTRIVFPEGTTWKWDLRVGTLERFRLTLPSGLKLLEVHYGRSGESALAFLSLDITKDDEVAEDGDGDGENLG